MLTKKENLIFFWIFLIFCVFSSKQILVYNEETLVALSFFSFLLFIFRYFGKNIKEGLNERGEGIKAELQNSITFEQNFLNDMSGEHRRGKKVFSALSSLYSLTQNELKKSGENSKKGLIRDLSEQTDRQFQNLLLSIGSEKMKELGKVFLLRFVVYKKKAQQMNLSNVSKVKGTGKKKKENR